MEAEDGCIKRFQFYLKKKPPKTPRSPLLPRGCRLVQMYHLYLYSLQIRLTELSELV